MAANFSDILARHFRGGVTPSDTEATDQQLLDWFSSQKSEAAFAELVRRHGPMVLGVCRRIVRNEQDADDAFQATFLILARKASRLVSEGTIGGWLHGVAHRAALKARQTASRRRAREARAARPEGVEMTESSDVLSLIEQEIGRLPERYRDPLILCGLCGRSRSEVATELAIPEGTLASRLAKARELLAERLRRRGVVVPTAIVATSMSSTTGTAVPTSLVDATVKTAVGVVPVAVRQIALEVTRAMFLNKVRTSLLFVVVGAIICVVGLGVMARPSADQPALQEDAPPKPVAEKIEDGVYLLKSDGDGQKATLTDGSPAILGKRLSESIGVGVSLQSWTNDNSHFHLRIRRLGPLPKEVTEVQTALVVNGVVLHLGRPEKLDNDQTAETSVNVDTAEAAKILAERYKIEPKLRKHPGHRFSVRWVPDKRQYQVGEEVILKLEIKNTGTESFRFTHGGKQRGARDNQFRFIAQEGIDGKGLADIGDPRNFGGIGQSIALKPGETWTAKVELSKWFKFTKPDTYQITGVLEMPIMDASGAGAFWSSVWDDLAVGECSIRVVARKK